MAVPGWCRVVGRLTLMSRQRAGDWRRAGHLAQGTAFVGFAGRMCFSLPGILTRALGLCLGVAGKCVVCLVGAGVLRECTIMGQMCIHQHRHARLQQGDCQQQEQGAETPGELQGMSVSRMAMQRVRSDHAAS